MPISSMIQHRPCPVCRGLDVTVLFQQRFDRLSGAHLLDGYDVAVCDHCGAGFADLIPEQAEFDRYYRDLSKYDGGGSGLTSPPKLEKRLEDIAHLLREYIPSPSTRTLEIGCGHGQLLSILRQQGFSQLTGSDPSPECANAARQFYGLEVLASTVFTVPVPQQPYEFLILTGVMEHIRDLDATIDRFHELLSPEGRIYLEVPDASRLEPHMDAPYQEFSVEHINFFSPASLNNLMMLRGFAVVAGGRALRPMHEISTYTAWGVYQRSSARFSIQKDLETQSGLSAYIEGCRRQDSEIREKIRRGLPNEGRIVVWGVGAHTLRLLATGGLDPSWIEVFVDSNRKYQTSDLRGIPVISPDELRSYPQPILISSRGFQAEIQKQIQGSLGLPNPLILLYE